MFYGEKPCCLMVVDAGRSSAAETGSCTHSSPWLLGAEWGEGKALVPTLFCDREQRERWQKYTHKGKKTTVEYLIRGYVSQLRGQNSFFIFFFLVPTEDKVSLHPLWLLAWHGHPITSTVGLFCFCGHDGRNSLLVRLRFWRTNEQIEGEM